MNQLGSPMKVDEQRDVRMIAVCLLCVGCVRCEGLMMDVMDNDVKG